MTARFAERSSAEWMDDLGAAGVPIAPVQLPEELADDQQVVAAGHMREIEHDITGPQRVVAPVVELSATPTTIERASPRSARTPPRCSPRRVLRPRRSLRCGGTG